MNTNTFVRPSFDGKIFIGVEVNVGGEHFLIATQDLSNKERNWEDTMKLLEQTDNKTFTYKQICAVMMFHGEINTILRENGGEPLDKWYWLCVEDTHYSAFLYYGYYGLLNSNDKHSTYSCRAVLALDAPLETLPINETDRLSDLEKKVMGLTEDMDKIKKTYSSNMERYTIYCTEEQTKKALELGAPIRKCLTIDGDDKGAHNTFPSVKSEFTPPTAEQMIGWLEEQKEISEISLIKSLRSGWMFAVYVRGTWLDVEDSKDTFYTTRKEATIVAIDAALDYLISNKKYMATIYTSYYGNHRNFPRNSIYIQISTSSPKYFSPSFSIKSVFPDWNTMVKPYKDGLIDEAEYTKRYRKRLEGNKEEILKTMKAFDSSQFQGRATIMLCYCKKGNFCHRNILREWLNENGIDCKEL